MSNNPEGKIESSLRVKQVVIKVLDASGTKFEVPSAALDAEGLRTMGDVV